MKQLRKLTAILLVFAVAFSCAGCGKKKMTDKQYEELAGKQAEKNRKNVVLRITVDGQTKEITAYDVVYFLAYNERQAYEEKSSKEPAYRALYGDDFNYFEMRDSNGTMMKDSYKSAAFSTIAYTYILYYEALNAGVQLEELRRVKLDSATSNFLNSYSAEQRARVGMTADCIRETYEKVFLADQYGTLMTSDFKVDEEAAKATVDKEDYRVYQTDYLYVAKYDYDEDFQKVEFSAEESAARKAAMDDAFERTKNGEDMMTIRSSYDSIMSYGTRDIYRTDNTLEPAYIENSMNLKEGECVFLETTGGYYVIYLENNHEFVGYDEAVSSAIEKAKSTGVAEWYMTFESKYNIEKTAEWDKIEIGKYAITQ
ncbi:MAG: hypothetical protein J5845_03910 [Lachnospiraceae bacterium]|nr:hypothetical protein [Lachnospiraceae bacterium]